VINVIVLANGGEELLKTLSSILYQVNIFNYKIYVLKLEDFDETNYLDFPVVFCSHWKEIYQEIDKKKDQYITFVAEGDLLSSPFVLSSFIDRFQNNSCDACFGSYIFDYGGNDFQNHFDDMHHFFGKMYRTDVFFQYFPKRFSISNFFYLNYLLLWKKIVYIDKDFRNYIIGYNHYLMNDYWNQQLYQKNIISLVFKLNQKSREAYDLVISILLSAYIHYLYYHEVIEKDTLRKMLPNEISFSEKNMDIIRSNEYQIMILCSSLSFLDFLNLLKEDLL